MFVLAGCSSEINYAPVSEISMLDPIPRTGCHQVAAGETLYEIAWRYGLDYRYLAERNRIKPPYAIFSGQKIYLQGGNSTVISLVVPDKKNPLKTSKSGRNKLAGGPHLSLPRHGDVGSNWVWPAKGRVIDAFSALHKGINIAGNKGEPIYSVSSGKVVYCGNGLRGYGNLIIIKHNSIYLSAYAHNNKVFVKEGDQVLQGQKIAEMGNTGTDRIMLHFEMRRAGKPVDPVSLLVRRTS